MLKTAYTEGSLLGRDEVSFTTYYTIWQCGCYPSELDELLLQEQTGQLHATLLFSV